MHTIDPLADSLLRHLRDEEALLRESLALLTGVSAALRAGDLGAVAAAQPAQESLAAALQAVHAARLAPVEALAAAVGLPGEGLTLGVLAMRLPEPWADQARKARDRLIAVAAEIAAVQGRNANLIAHLRSFFRGALRALTAADAPVRYGRSGVCLVPAAGGAIQASG
jgi:hypothetical protein